MKDTTTYPLNVNDIPIAESLGFGTRVTKKEREQINKERKKLENN